MKKNSLFCCGLLCFFTWQVAAQQIQSRSILAGFDFVFNPGMTAVGQHGRVGAAHRQDWLGFEGAPQTSTAFGEIPVVYERMSAGLLVQTDRAGAFTADEITGTYNYKIRPGFFYRDQISVGVSGGAKRLHFDGNNLRVQTDNDPAAVTAVDSDTQAQFGGGFFYVSDRRMYTRERGAFYIGAGGMQLTTFDSGIFPEAGYRQTIHTNAILGGMIVKNFFTLKPEIWADYALKSPLILTASLTAEWENILWAGGSFRTDKTVAGYIGIKIPTGDYRRFYAGFAANYNIGNVGEQRGVGYEAIFTYDFEM